MSKSPLVRPPAGQPQSRVDLPTYLPVVGVFVLPPASSAAPPPRLIFFFCLPVSVSVRAPFPLPRPPPPFFFSLPCLVFFLSWFSGLLLWLVFRPPSFSAPPPFFLFFCVPLFVSSGPPSPLPPPVPFFFFYPPPFSFLFFSSFFPVFGVSCCGWCFFPVAFFFRPPPSVFFLCVLVFVSSRSFCGAVLPSCVLRVLLWCPALLGCVLPWLFVCSVVLCRAMALMSLTFG